MEKAEGKIRAICTSDERGVEKKEVDSAVFVAGEGIRGDAHAGNWHRQVSILSGKRIDEFNRKGAGVKNGDFGENLVVDGIDCVDLPVGTILSIGDGDQSVQLRVTQKGKECHTHCRIYKRMGECIMPHQGIFTEVVTGGTIKKGDGVSVTYPDVNRPFQAAVIVLSDKASQGAREDLSGPAASEILKENGYEVIETLVLPDDAKRLKMELIRLSDGREADLIITSGGTGFSLRDITPEVTMDVADRNAPGIAEYMRYRSGGITDRAMLSRGVSVIRGRTVIVNLPGSPKAVKECLGFIMNALEHGIKVLRGGVSECAADRGPAF
ncbi:MAG: MOSC domain-containing protein [Lachnospiraceae bacterium]|nr:MOSC domain-containing protein [Lachnospiraceae bacterium]